MHDSKGRSHCRLSLQGSPTPKGSSQVPLGKHLSPAAQTIAEPLQSSPSPRSMVQMWFTQRFERQAQPWWQPSRCSPVALHPQGVQMGLSSGYIAVLVLALYISSDAVRELYESPTLLWFVCPLLLYWISRIWLLAHRGEIQHDPVMFAISDSTTWGVGLASCGIVFAAGGAW